MREAVFTRERFVDVEDDLVRLARLNWHETGPFADMPLDPDLERYRRIDAGGLLRVFVVRVEGRIVGYSLFIVSTHPHYKNSTQATQDVIFLAPLYRDGHTGARLIRFGERTLRQEGVDVVYIPSSEVRNIGPLLRREGYKPIETVHGKRLN